MHCPNCNSENVVKNEFNATNKQMYRCKHCGRQFILNPKKTIIPPEIKELINRLLNERMSLAAIARAVGVSETWLQHYVNELYEQIPHEVTIKKSQKGDLQLNVMNYGHISEIKKINNGFGLQLIAIQEKLLELT